MEAIGELIEKLIIANIKLWMVKDAQTCLVDEKSRETVQNELDKLARIEVISDDAPMRKLLETVEANRNSSELETLKELLRKDIELCRLRAALRAEINQKLGDTTPADNQKDYGERP